MNPHRPTESAPGGMRGSGRMHDPTEAAHDRLRRRLMNVAFLLLVAVNVAHAMCIGVRDWDWLTIALLIAAAIPLGLAVKVFELRFKMSAAERQRALAELPARRKIELVAYAALLTGVLLLNSAFVTWALFGAWGYDFVTYYHDHPERMRHLYSVMKILEELRELPAPWAWTIPALAWSLYRLLATGPSP